MQSMITRVDQPSDQRFSEAVSWAKAAKRNVRVRAELRLYNPESQQHVSWPGAAWTLDVHPDGSVAAPLRECFNLLVERLSTEGLSDLMRRLQLKKGEKL